MVKIEKSETIVALIENIREAMEQTIDEHPDIFDVDGCDVFDQLYEAAKHGGEIDEEVFKSYCYHINVAQILIDNDAIGYRAVKNELYLKHELIKANAWSI